MKGDKQAFAALMEACKLSMFKTSIAILKNSEDAADAMQEALLACWINIPKLKKPEYFHTWMTRILINKCYDIRKKNLAAISSENIPESGEEDKRIEEISGSIMDDIAENYSVILNLYYGSGFSVKEIAGLTGLYESGVKTRLSRGREAYKRAYLREREAEAI